MKPERNKPCPCGSGRKFKRCHGGPTPPQEIPSRYTPEEAHKLAVAQLLGQMDAMAPEQRAGAVLSLGRLIGDPRAHPVTRAAAKTILELEMLKEGAHG